MQTTDAKSTTTEPTSGRSALVEASERAQRDLLLATLQRPEVNWSPSRAALVLNESGGAANIVRAIKRLGLEQAYAEAKTRLGLKPGRRAKA